MRTQLNASQPETPAGFSVCMAVVGSSRRKLLGGLLLLLGVPAVAQTSPPKAQEAARPFGGATQIVVRTPDGIGPAVQKMRAVLVAQGYVLDTVRADYLTTKARAFAAPAGGLAVPIVYVFRVAASAGTTGTQLVFAGESVDDRNPKYHFVIPMRWIGPGDQLPDQLCFSYADKIARAYPGGAVTYRRKPR